MKNSTFQLTELGQIENVIAKLREKLFSINVPQETFLDIQLALMEAVGNAFLHGVQGKERPLVELEWLINTNSIRLRIKDNGLGFNYKDLGCFHEPDILAEKGRGLFLMYSVLDEVRFNEQGNEIYCCKKWT
ncbi:MAG: ATP-binding protein [Peptococcales bacterium]|jgi:serine/threonine-protein kinase RsbW